MPPVGTDEAGRRLIHVGIMSLQAGSTRLETNEIVSVHIPSGQVLRYPAGAPATALVSPTVCNPPPAQSCAAATGSCSALYHYEWPADHPVWKFDAMHPSCTTSIQSS